MIVYNVKRRWFTMKAEAVTYRRAEGLPIRLAYREELPGRNSSHRRLRLPVSQSGTPPDRSASSLIPDSSAACN